MTARAVMQIEITNAALEARMRRQLEAKGVQNFEELLSQLLETQEEQDRWLLANRDSIDAKIQRGIEELDRGEGIPEDQLDDYLHKLRSSRK